MTSTINYPQNIQNSANFKPSTSYDVDNEFITNLSKEVTNELIQLDNIKDQTSKQIYSEIMNQAHLKLMQRYYNRSKVNDFTVKQIESTKNAHIQELRSIDKVM